MGAEHLPSTEPQRKGDRTAASKKLIPPKLCKAHSSVTGQPCRSYAIVGGAVCVAHGGRAPQVREAARRRVLQMVPDALDGMAVLAGIFEGVPGAKNENVRQKALADILDRAGLKAADEVIHSDQELSNEDLDRLIAAALEARQGRE